MTLFLLALYFYTKIQLYNKIPGGDSYMAYEMLKNAISECNNIVFMSGLGLLREIGVPNYRDEQEAYDIELEYGYSPEDLFSTSFFSTRPEQFYRYYKHKILYLDGKPNEAYYALARLEQQGKLKTIITRSIYGIHQMAGSKHVLELQGSIYHNFCMNCGATHSVEYIKNSVGIPHCEKCQGPIRPGVSLYGDMLNNTIISQAAEAVSNAEMLIVAGTHLNSFLSERLLQYFRGIRLVLINNEHYFSDTNANIIIHENVSDVLPAVIP